MEGVSVWRVECVDGECGGVRVWVCGGCECGGYWCEESVSCHGLTEFLKN